MRNFDTGPGGGLLFGFRYVPDPLAAVKRPYQYQRAEIDYGGSRLAEGVVAKKPEEIEDGSGWDIMIAVGPESAVEVTRAVGRGEIGIRLLG